MKSSYSQKILPYGLCYLLILQSCSISKKKAETLESGRNALYENYCMPELVDKTWYSSGKKAPLFSGLEGISFKISTKSKEAQRYFNQGMMLAYGFNHAEAARSFFEAARQDSTCAMCWWGFAYVHGPNYNGGMDPENLQRAFDAIQKAAELSSGSTQKEKDLIHAMTYRYSNNPDMARSGLDSAYASQMRRVYQKYPDDEDIATLFAESLMDMHPWDLFRKDGSAQPWTPEIVNVVESSLKKSPNHAGLNHLYIHALEMSSDVDKSLASAEMLGKLAPGSGHLVHMPSHTYIRIGKYHEGTLANLKAVEVDSLYTVTCHAFGVYPLAYYPHNYHFLAACGALGGESQHAMIGANKTKAHAYEKLLLDPYWTTLQHYYSIPMFVQVKLGLWNEIQNYPQPEKELKYPGVIWNYAQGMAALAGNKTGKAEKYLKEMKTIMQDSALKTYTIWGVNRLYDICRIASETLEGEIMAKYGKYPEAIRLLKNAVAIEDELRYQEPPDWFFSVRHNLGAVLFESGNYTEAVTIYQQDLKNYPENGWALMGMMRAYQKLGVQTDYLNVKNRFEVSWQHADIQINTSRIL